MSQPQYFLKRGEKVFGPHSLDQIERLHDQGKLNPTDLVSKSKDGSWHRFGDVAEKLFPSKTSSEPKPHGYFIRRGSKIIGPHLATQIKKLDENGKLANSDDVSKSMAGPWDKYGMVRENLLIEALPIEQSTRKALKKESGAASAASNQNPEAHSLAEFNDASEAYVVDEVDVYEPDETEGDILAELPGIMLDIPQASISPLSNSTYKLHHTPTEKPAQSEPQVSKPNKTLMITGIVGGSLALLVGIGILISIASALKTSTNPASSSSIELGEEVSVDSFPTTNGITWVNSRPFNSKEMILYKGNYSDNRYRILLEENKYGKLVFSEFPDGEIMAYDLHDVGKAYNAFMYVTQNHVVATDRDEIVVVRKTEKTLSFGSSGKPKSGNLLAISPDGRLAVSKERNSEGVSVWEVATGNEIKFIDLGKEVNSITFSTDSKQFAFLWEDPRPRRDADSGYTDPQTGIFYKASEEEYFQIIRVVNIDDEAFSDFELYPASSQHGARRSFKDLDIKLQFSPNNSKLVCCDDEGYKTHESNCSVVNLLSGSVSQLPTAIKSAYFFKDDIVLVEEERDTRERGVDKKVRDWHFRRLKS